MDHQHALLTYAAERYASGQMDSDEMDQFEEHFFSCPECAQAVEDCQMLLANGRVLVNRQTIVTPMPAPAAAWTASWLQWAPVAASVVFASALGYQYAVVYPDMKEQIADARSPRYVQSVSLRGVTRSEALPKAISKGNRTLILSFYPDKPYSRVEYEIHTPGGAKVLSGVLGQPLVAPSGESQIALTLDSEIPAGDYDAKVLGLEDQNRVVIGERRISVQ